MAEVAAVGLGRVVDESAATQHLFSEPVAVVVGRRKDPLRTRLGPVHDGVEHFGWIRVGVIDLPHQRRWCLIANARSADARVPGRKTRPTHESSVAFEGAAAATTATFPRQAAKGCFEVQQRRLVKPDPMCEILQRLQLMRRLDTPPNDHHAHFLPE